MKKKGASADPLLVPRIEQYGMNHSLTDPQVSSKTFPVTGSEGGLALAHAAAGGHPVRPRSPNETLRFPSLCLPLRASAELTEE